MALLGLIAERTLVFLSTKWGPVTLNQKKGLEEVQSNQFTHPAIA
jgi:hypothetical protein